VVKKVAPGVEIAEDRAQTSIVAAGYVNKHAGIVLVDLLAYLTRTEATSTVLRLRRTRTVQSVIIDPHSAGATLMTPRPDAEVTVTQPRRGDPTRGAAARCAGQCVAAVFRNFGRLWAALQTRSGLRPPQVGVLRRPRGPGRADAACVGRFGGRRLCASALTGAEARMWQR
jgi:hypothetical protein